MRINPINYYQDNSIQPNFKSLIKDKSALKVIKEMSDSDVAEFNKIEKILSKTKFWDLKVYGVNKFKSFKFEFISKKNQHGIISDRIYPYNRNKDSINIYTITTSSDYGYNAENIVETLKFSSKKKAEELYNMHLEDVKASVEKHWILTPLENLKSRLLHLNMLEESYKYMRKKIHKTKVVNTLYSTKNTIG